MKRAAVGLAAVYILWAAGANLYIAYWERKWRPPTWLANASE
jgi:hypothetical protein